jgi:hypothetical protein
VVALVWRAVLTRLYYGSEEEDFGNLGLIIGTLQSGFTYVETEHMPLFTTLAAAVTGVLGDAETGGEVVAVVAGALVAGLVTWIGWRWFSPAVGVLAGLLVAFQPDSALTAATPLRISTYVALCTLAVLLLGERRTITGAIVLALAFLTRFDLAFTLLPALVVLAAVQRDRRHLVAVAIVAATVLAWAVYYRSAMGSFAFWGSVAERSTTGGGGGLGTLGLVLLRIVPLHLGYVAAVAAPVGLVFALRATDEGRSRFQARWLALCALAVFGFFCVTVALSGYRWDHNLFWKWLCASVPWLVLFASVGLVRGASWLISGRRRFGRGVLAILVAIAVVSTAWTWTDQTASQIARSDLWYGTQVRLMRWVEKAYPPDVGLVADLIPATWLSRKPNERRVFRWSGDEVPQGLDARAFGAWLLDNRIALVITFGEEWVGSGRKAPWLSRLAPTTAGPLQLTPVALEPDYGFVAWQVSGAATIPLPSTPPPVDGGAVQIVVIPGGAP